VILPSSLRDAGDLGELATHLAAAGFRVLRPTPRGMGRSTGSLSGLTLHLLAADIAATIRALGQGRPAVVLGHAAGHFVARVLDLDYPALVQGIVIAAAAARVFPPEVAGSVDLIADPRRPRAERLMHLRRAFLVAGSDPRPWLEGWHPALGPAYRAAARVPDKSRWWPVSHAPILDLQAADDPWRPPATRRELKEALGDLVTVRVIGGASHALPYERPDAVAREAIAWRRGLDAGG
jgi:pimeloyl-ACP methyl ester carboxylesterase